MEYDVHVWVALSKVTKRGCAMAPLTRKITTLAAALVALAAVPAAATAQAADAVHPAQAGQFMERLPNIMPMNDLPNPYTAVDNWVRLPTVAPGDPRRERTWTPTGSTSGRSTVAAPTPARKRI